MSLPDGWRHAARVGPVVKPRVERLARLGYAAKGLVYLVVGALAVQVALGLRDHAAGARGALAVIVQQPSGRFLLGVVAAGLAGYVVWRFAQAILDPGGRATGVKGVARRAVHAFNGLAYSLLVYTAVCLLLGAAAGDADTNLVRARAARFLDLPLLGSWPVGMAGALIVAVGLLGLYGAASGRFRAKLLPQARTGTTGTWVAWLGQIGLAARGVVFGIIGGSLLRAAWEVDTRRVRDVSGALEMLARPPYGPWVLGFVALGLVAYGLYLLVEARFRRIPG